MQTISSAIEWWANIMPDALAISIDEDEITYRQLNDWSGRVAADLIARGVQAGDRVCICAANSADYCILLHGIMRAGAIASPLNMRYTRHEIDELLEDLTPRLIFADDDRAAHFDECLPLSSIRSLQHGEPVQIDRQPNPDDVVVIIATSGSTAKPKGVMLTNRSMTSYAAAWAIEEPNCGKGMRVIVPAPLSTSAGFVQLVHYTVLGCSLNFVSAFEPAQFLNLLVDKKINAFGAVPLFFELIANQPGFDDADLSHIRIATTGGASVSRALQDRWAHKGVILRQIYGQTEVGGNGTIMPEHLASSAPEKCGRGGVFTEIAIKDEQGRFVPAGTPGEIVMRGPGMMKGYWNNPKATADTIKDGWLHSGDIGVLDDDGLLTFVDRMKDLIISGGLNISAVEVERAVAAFPGVAEVMVIAARDDKFGETPMAVIHAANEIDVTALIAHCNERLADFKVPRYVAVETDPLPRTATGKLHKPAMREKYKDAAATLPKVR